MILRISKRSESEERACDTFEQRHARDFDRVTKSGRVVRSRSFCEGAQPKGFYRADGMGRPVFPPPYDAE
jgi:hypothetical protein